MHACDFEEADICGYTQDLTDDFDWLWGTGATPTLYTGPSVDVTLATEEGNTSYDDIIFIESRFPFSVPIVIEAEWRPGYGFKGKYAAKITFKSVKYVCIIWVIYFKWSSLNARNILLLSWTCISLSYFKVIICTSRPATKRLVRSLDWFLKGLPQMRTRRISVGVSFIICGEMRWAPSMLW